MSEPQPIESGLMPVDPATYERLAKALILQWAMRSPINLIPRTKARLPG